MRRVLWNDLDWIKKATLFTLSFRRAPSTIPKAILWEDSEFITDITAIKNLEKEVLDVTERERQKIGYELHDDLGQHLIGIDVMTKVLRDKIIPLSDENARYARRDQSNWLKEQLKRPVV